MKKSIALRIFYLFLFFSIGIYGISCNTEHEAQSNNTSILQQAKIITNTTQPGGVWGQGRKPLKPSLDKEVELPKLIWTTFESKILAVAYDSGYCDCAVKEEVCLIGSSGTTPFTSGIKVKILETSSCENVHYSDGGEVPKKYVIGLTKIQVLETGIEGWTWSDSVKIESR